ncbi:MAG: ISNCY family transposase [Bacteroidota bacterium]
MGNNLVMSQKERDRLVVIKEVIKGRLSAREAGRLLELSRRHVFRLMKRYRQEGDVGLIHRLRGCPSNRGYPKRLKTRVLELYWRPEYRDYGPTLFAEVLLKDHKILVDHETVRRWLMAKGGTNVQRRKRPHRSKRHRRSAIGELVQFDGSDHDWFEGRGPQCTLLHMIDDATNRVFLRFAGSENTADCMRTFWAYSKRYGLPRCLYVDRGTVFYAEGGAVTDFGRAMATLGVQIIYANSSQAKGRVERGNRTQQDRLIKAMRRQGISTIASANRFLERSYMKAHNSRFALPPDGLPDVHRALDSGLKLEQILCFQTDRYLRHDYTITLDSTFVQILKGPYVLPRPEQHVIVRRYLDDSLHIFSSDQELRFEILPGKPPPRKPPLVMPASNHPWRLKTPIGKSKRRRRR